MGAKSIAFPLISAGAYGWPLDDAVRQALTVLRAAQPVHLAQARLVLFGHDAYRAAVAVAEQLGPYLGTS